MRPRPSWVKRIGIILALLFAGVLAVALFGWIQVTADLSDPLPTPPTKHDTEEAKRKINVFREALKSGKLGWIRLSEAEANAYLDAQIGKDSKERTNEIGTTRLTKSRIVLEPQALTVFCWARQQWLGREFDLVWQRSGGFVSNSNRWVFETKSMQLGKVSVPPRFWGTIEEKLHSIDAVLANEFSWVVKAPFVEVKADELSHAPELRLYTYFSPKFLGASNR